MASVHSETVGSAQTAHSGQTGAHGQQHEKSDHVSQGGSLEKNVGQAERMASLVGGALLALVGVSRMSLTNVILVGVGASLLFRGSTGHCSLYQQLGMNTNQEHDSH